MSNDTPKSDCLKFSAPELDLKKFLAHILEVRVRIENIHGNSASQDAALDAVVEILSVIAGAEIVPAPRTPTYTTHWERRGGTVYRVSDDDGQIMSVMFHTDPTANEYETKSLDVMLDTLNRLSREPARDPRTDALVTLNKSLQEILAEIRLGMHALNGIARGVDK